MSDSLKLDARWTDDCQGKKDYDGPIIEISTRYWPRGGGFSVFNRAKPELGMQGNDARPEIKPSAHCSLIIRHGNGDDESLSDRQFEGETFEEIAAQVEAFAQAQMDRVVSILRAEFQK